MKKFFGTSSKSKTKGVNQTYTDETTPPATPGLPTPIHAAHAMYQQQQLAQSVNFRTPHSGFQPLRPSSVFDPDLSLEDLSYEPPPSIPVSRTSSLGSVQGASPAGNLLPGASPANSINPSSPSLPPANNSATVRKKQPPRDNSGGSVPTPAQAPGVLGILKALDPAVSTPNQPYASQHPHNPSSSDLHHIPPSGRDTPSSYMQHNNPDDPPHKDKSSKWSLFSRNNSHLDDVKDKDRRREEKIVLSAREQEVRRQEKEKREERERHWQFVDREDRKEREPFRREEKTVDRDREIAELTRMIGYLTATASEDWALVLEVCERASSNEANAKEAVRALRREFKYGPPAAQLSAARLWAIMLRNSSDIFITQCTSRKFLDTLEDLLTNTGGGPFSSGKGTSPVVRERVMDVLAAAAYASGSKRDTGFRGLWKKVKPADKPDEGVPFDTDDAMFNPPDISANGRGSYYESTPPSAAAQSDSTNATLVAEPKKERDREGRHKDREHREHREHRDRDKDRDKDRDREHRHKDREHKEKKSSRNRIIPLEEDIRRLFQECKIGQGNASLLSQALIHAKVEELKKGERGQVMKEFRLRCLSSQELIAAQIPWATAGAERSRKEKEREKALLYGENNNDSSRTSRDKTRDRSIAQLADAAGIPGTDPPIDEQTTEEKLLAALLEANEELLGALGQYDDLERVALERQAEEKSRKEVRMDRRAIATLEQQQQFEDISAISGAGPGGSTVHLDRSRSSSPASHRASRPSSMMVQHPLPQHPHSLLTHPAQQQHLAVQYSLSNHSPEIPGTTLAPPRAPPHGPRSPASGHGHGHTRTGSSGFPPSRTPSPNTPGMDYSSSGTGTGESGGGNSTPEVVRGRELVDGINSLHVDKSRAAWAGRISMDDSSDEEILTPIKPSAKALGKRRVEVHDDMENSFHPDDLYYDQTGVLGSTDPYNPYTSEGDVPIPPTGDGGAFDYNSDSDDSESAYYPNGRPRSRNNGLLHHLHHPQVHFVYDAAAERTQQRIRDMEMENQMERSVEVGNVH
ncbi:hypothetical protein J3R30DRAFT_2398111 [Lentinula aciculospora]|uniref:VHS domain-containing protein n=1 Tax=Lentinula aciculospora TaxID=153920 RepID=A0A9W9AFU4_9AGAR|nr:hypothetical protein J3R30DRAFT_2398111 [Lentinula aciculospora]